MLDSNVIIASFAARGLCASLFELCLGKHQVVLSEKLLEEIQKNLQKKIRMPLSTVTEIISYLKGSAEIVTPHKVEIDVLQRS